MNIPGIDELAGLEQAGNDQELYQELLEIYYEDGMNMLDEFAKDLQHTDLQLFIVNTHAMKSASLNIGALELSVKFKEMEFAGKDQDMATIESKFPACLREFTQLLEHLKEYLTQESGSEEDNVPDKTFLQKMKSALLEMETDEFDDLMEQAMNAGYHSIAKAKLMKVQAAYDDFDFEQAVKLLDELMQ